MQYFSYAILLTATLLFCIQTQAFCIYNNLNEGGNFEIYDAIHEGSNTAFRTTLGHNGDKECCHYENKDCNPSQVKHATVFFLVSFKFGQDSPSQAFHTSCHAGGALAFYGSATDFYGICTPSDNSPSRRATLTRTGS